MKNTTIIILLSILLFVSGMQVSCAAEQDPDIKISVTKTFHPNGMLKTKTEVYNSISEKIKVKEIITEYNENGQFIKTETNYFDGDPLKFAEKKNEQRIKEEQAFYEARVFKKNINIEKTETQDDDIGVTHPDIIKADKIANQDVPYGTTSNGKPKYKYKDAVNFLDDANITSPHLVTDRDFITHQKTYRYRFTDYNIDLKLQKWKPGIEYWLNPGKTKSIDLIYDRNLGPDLGGGWLLRYRKIF